MNAFSNFLNAHKANADNQITHTRIGHKELNIYGGSYHIPDNEYNNFMDLYYTHVFENGNIEYMTEKQKELILIDFDLHYATDITERQHNKNHIIDMIMKYNDKINELIDLNNEPYEVYILEKDNVNIQPNKTKDGIHAVFCINMNRQLQGLLRENIMPELENIWSDLPLINGFEDVVDDSIIKGFANWQLFGSCKPNHDCYKITMGFKIENDEHIEILIKPENQKELFYKISARNPTYKSYPVREGIVIPEPKPKKKSNLSGMLTPPPELNFKTIETDEYLDLLFNYLGNDVVKGKKTVSYHDRLCIRFALKSNGYDKQHYIDYCNLREGKGKDNADDDWEKLDIKEITPMYVLEGMAKRLIPNNYRKWSKKRDNKIKEIGKEMLMKSISEQKENVALQKIDNCISDDLEGCILMKKKFGESIKKCGDTWYVNKPNTNYWSRGAEYVKELIMTSRFTKKVGEHEKSYSANATGCTNIFKALEISSENFPLNENFVNDINKKTKGKLYFQDKYWDFNKKKFFDITKDDIPLIFIKRNAPKFDFTKEEIDEFKGSVLNMFATDDEINLYLHAISRGLGGYIEDKKFYVMKGLRNSGKGILQEQAYASFGEYCCIYDVPMSKTSYKADASDRRWVLTSQAHIKRIGFTNEVANIAGKNELTIDGNEMKKVIASGGDIFQSRGHYCDELEVKFNATTFMSLNEIPNSNPADGLSNMILFDMPFKFVEKNMVQEDTVLYREQDTKLKQKIQTNERWRDIYLYLIFEAFKDESVEFSKMNESSKSEMEKSTKNADLCNPVKLFNNAFVKDEKGWVCTTDIKDILAPSKLNDTKFGKFLKDRGFIPKRGKSISKMDEFGREMKDENGKVIKFNPQGYEGLSFKKVINEDDELINEDHELIN